MSVGLDPQEQVFQAVINLTSSTCAEVHAAGHAVLQNLKVHQLLIFDILL